ncbi:MAG: FAD:protein FMN transferase [Muribaculaceae bacterium]|nr:FAD:protein FMN transferase [Muribaculaceae bacterium]
MIWNTLYHITYKGDPNLKDSILPVLNEVGASLSVFDPHSLVSALNKGREVEADIHLIKVFDASIDINRLSKGKFDPTVSPLVDAWGFGSGHTPSSDTLAIDSIMDFIGITKTYRKGNIIYKEDERTKFNFSAIAKGYGCDAVGEMFRRNGVKDYMVEIGGELALSGHSPSGSNWRIAVDAPQEGNNPGEETVLILSLTDMGIATSGNYRNFREDGGIKTAHTISPETGRPILSEILSATVLAPTCMEADALATACMAGNAEEAKSLIKESHTESMLIFADSIWISPGFYQYIISEVSEPAGTGPN